MRAWDMIRQRQLSISRVCVGSLASITEKNKVQSTQCKGRSKQGPAVGVERSCRDLHRRRQPKRHNAFGGGPPQAAACQFGALSRRAVITASLKLTQAG